jgi:predicted nucleotidyltransferase
VNQFLMSACLLASEKGVAMERNVVIRTLKQHRNELVEQYGVQSLALFGSVARDQARSTSDVDLLVEFSRPTGLFGLFALQDHLESLLGCPVDLGTPDSLKPRLKSTVMAERINVI